MPAIEILPWRDKAVIAAEVFPSYSRSYYVLADRPELGTYIRVGPTDCKAHGIMREELRRTVRNESCDEHAVPIKSEADKSALQIPKLQARSVRDRPNKCPRPDSNRWKDA